MTNPIKTRNEYRDDRNRYYRDLYEHGGPRTPLEALSPEGKVPAISLSDEMSEYRQPVYDFEALMNELYLERMMKNPSTSIPQSLTNPSSSLTPIGPTPSERMKKGSLDFLIDKGKLSSHRARNLNSGLWNTAEWVVPPLWALHSGENAKRSYMEGNPKTALLHGGLGALAGILGAGSVTGTKLAGRVINDFGNKVAKRTPFDDISRMQLKDWGFARGKGSYSTSDPARRLSYKEPQGEFSFAVEPVPVVKEPDLVKELNAIIEEGIPRGRPQSGKYNPNSRALARRKEIFNLMVNPKWNQAERDAGHVMVERGRDPLKVVEMLDDLVGELRHVK